MDTPNQPINHQFTTHHAQYPCVTLRILVQSLEFYFENGAISRMAKVWNTPGLEVEVRGWCAQVALAATLWHSFIDNFFYTAK